MAAFQVAQAKMTPEQLKLLPAPADRAVNFVQDIKPIFEASCIKCHGRGRGKGEFHLDTRETTLKGGESGPAIVAGKSTESYLIELVSGVDPDNVMPRKGSKLTPLQVGLLRAWIDQGMPWEKEVSFAKKAPVNLHPRRPELPAARAGSGLSNPIDLLLQSYLESHQKSFGNPVADRVFARRVSLDIGGLLPSAEGMRAFEAEVSSHKRERLVDRLLGDHRRYAEHWLSFWNDALRNDYRGTGYIDGGRKQISSWLFSALARNLPYDQFVAQLIDPTPEAEGFVKGIVWRGTVNASQTPQMQAAQNIPQVFMGVNLKCASCHDSFINDWTLADSYGLANIFADAPLEIYECDKPTGKKAAVRFLYPELGEIPTGAPKAERQKRLAQIMTQKQNGRLTRTMVNRLWARFMGRGLVEPIDDMEQPAWNSDVLDWLAEDLADHGYDLKRTIQLILTSRAYQMPSISLEESKRVDFVFAGPAVRRMSAEQFCDSISSITGVWHSNPAVEFDFPAAQAAEAPPLAPLPAAVRWIWSDAGAAQKALPETVYFRKTVTLDAVPEEAFAVVSCDNSFSLYVNGKKAGSGKDFTRPNYLNLQPHLIQGKNVFAVAAVNHTPDNQPPSAQKPPGEGQANPAGLIVYVRTRTAGRVADWGADRSWAWSKAKAEGWEKPGFAEQDWKPAVELGDAGLAPWNLAEKLAQVLALGKEHGEFRSALVIADPLTLALGRPPREQVMTSRSSAATTLQALELTNGETLGQLFKRGAEKLLAEKPPSTSGLVEQLYRQALGRAPTNAEERLAETLVGTPIQREGLEDLLWAMAMLPEFQLIY